MPYYPALDSLRAFAALAVFTAHVEVVLGMYQLPNVSYCAPLVRLASEGVLFFFILSGFLITQLLLSDGLPLFRRQIGYFYVRRALRIWPLYYTVLIVGAAVHYFGPDLNWSAGGQLSESNVAQASVLYLIFLPNVAKGLFGDVAHVGHTWSVGVEEQFYLVWPLLLSAFKRTGPLLWGLFFITVCVSIAQLFVFSEYEGSHPLLWHVLDQPYGYLVLGGLYGYLHWTQERTLLAVLHSRLVEVFALICLVSYLTYPWKMPFGGFLHYVKPVVFGYFITLYAARKNPLVPLNYGWLRHLGRISYGIYMYHIVTLALVISFCRAWVRPGEYPLLFHIAVTTLGALATFLLATASWRFLERPFLQMKERFSPGANLPTEVDYRAKKIA